MHPIIIGTPGPLVNTPYPVLRPGGLTLSDPAARTPAEVRLDAADAYAGRIAREAEAWAALARERSRLHDATVARKALQATALTVALRARSLCLPSKLVGTSKHQPTLWTMVRDRVPFGAPLEVSEEGGRLVTSYEGEVVGATQPKHRWAPPLLAFGLTLHVLRVTGHDRDFTLGLNVLFGGVGHAVLALRHALGQDPLGSEELGLPASGAPSGGGHGSGDGPSGDGYAGRYPTGLRRSGAEPDPRG